MRVLIADDDAALRYALGVQLERWGYVPIVCEDGEAARQVLTGSAPPPLAILDWSMPGTDGVTLCREIRADASYIVKPFDWDVLRARVATGARIAKLQQSLAQRVVELQNALDTVKQLSGL